jgi:hypothetical protein
MLGTQLSPVASGTTHWSTARGRSNDIRAVGVAPHSWKHWRHAQCQ